MQGTAAPKTLTTTNVGPGRHVWDLAVGDYVWHRGAFRLVTAVNGQTVRMGRYALHVSFGYQVEVAA